MTSFLSIGDFSRATNLSVKTLRFYHESGLLEPAEIDPSSGYRRYGTAQIATAQVIRRFRELEMSLDDIRAVLATSDVAERDALIGSHLRRMKSDLDRSRSIIASLEGLLESPKSDAAIEHRVVAETRAAAITEVVDLRDAAPWYQGALGELYATLAAQGVEQTATAGGIFSNELFTDERGTATIFAPCLDEVRPLGRVTPLLVPAAELAVIAHRGRRVAWIARTAPSGPTWPTMPWASTGRCANTSWWTPTTPRTPWSGGRRSGGRSSPRDPHAEAQSAARR